MPEKKTIERAKKDKREGKSASTQAGEFVREEFEHIREGKHGARSPEQAIAIGLSEARRAGVDLPPPKKGKASPKTVKQAKRDLKDADLVPIRSGRRLDAHIPKGGTIEDVTPELLIDRGVLMVGPPERVYDQLREFYEKTGGFGTLLLVTGKDWGTNEQRATAMRAVARCRC